MEIFGEALADYFYRHKKSKLWLYNNYGAPEEMPLTVFFRDEHQMPDLELLALSHCRGHVLDIGAGVGSHALVLQNRSIEVTALEISAGACDIMADRGVRSIINSNIFSHDFGQAKFDTVLLLMNGIGLCQTVEGLREFLAFSKKLIKPGGQLLFDSSDIAYLYKDLPRPAENYYGEISYRYKYKGNFGAWFKWLYADKELLGEIAGESGWKMNILLDDEMDQFLVRLVQINGPLS